MADCADRGLEEKMISARSGHLRPAYLLPQPPGQPPREIDHGPSKPVPTDGHDNTDSTYADNTDLTRQEVHHPSPHTYILFRSQRTKISCTTSGYQLKMIIAKHAIHRTCHDRQPFFPGSSAFEACQGGLGVCSFCFSSVLFRPSMALTASTTQQWR